MFDSLTELTASLSFPEVVANDCRKCEAPPDPSSQAMVCLLDTHTAAAESSTTDLVGPLILTANSIP